MKIFVLLVVLSLLTMVTAQEKNPYELIICDYQKFKLLKVDKSGVVTWSYKPQGKVWDFELTQDNNLVFPIVYKPFEVRCISFDKKLKWQWSYREEYREIINITSSEGGLILSGQKPSEAVFLNLAGKLKKKIDIPTNFHSHHGELGNIYPLKSGHFLVQLWGEGAVIELNALGKEVWRYKVTQFGKGKYPEGCVQDVLRLANGNTMIACGTQARIIEVTPGGEVIWILSATDMPALNLTNACSLQLLKNGSILVTNFLRGNTGKGAHAFILSNERQVTWMLRDHGNIKAASKVFAIE